MITECANPACRQPFQYFRNGKLFIVDSRSGQWTADTSDAQPPRFKLEHFWLCQSCSATMTLVIVAGIGPKVAPILSDELPLSQDQSRAQPAQVETCRMPGPVTRDSARRENQRWRYA